MGPSTVLLFTFTYSLTHSPTHPITTLFPTDPFHPSSSRMFLFVRQLVRVPEWPVHLQVKGILRKSEGGGRVVSCNGV